MQHSFVDHHEQLACDKQPKLNNILYLNRNIGQAKWEALLYARCLLTLARISQSCVGHIIAKGIV